jgi:RimJ/RimL family protein N-acetyltransferase
MMTVVSQTAILTTNRLVLRPWLDADREPFARMNADPRVMEFFAVRPSREESDAMVDRIETHFREHGFGLWAAVLRRGGAFLGFVGLDIPSYEAPYSLELGWRLAAKYWGQGLATEGAHAVVGYGFQTLGLEEIVATTVPANTRSRRVMEKLGMTHDSANDFEHPLLPEGHPLRWHVLYRLRRLDWQRQPNRKVSVESTTAR